MTLARTAVRHRWLQCDKWWSGLTLRIGLADNGIFDEILRTCRDRGLLLVVYAQTANAVARQFPGADVTALPAEPFPFSQFSAEQTVLHRYHAQS